MTGTLAISSISLRPQPVGIFPPPVSFLLLPESPEPKDTGSRDALAALLAGNTSFPIPAEWRFYVSAVAGNFNQALREVHGDGPLSVWNRFVLAPSQAAYHDLRRSLPQELMPLLEAAAYTFGLSEAAPLPPGDLDAELRALVLLTIASSQLEQEQTEQASDTLEEALSCAREASPLLASQILHQLAGIERGASPAMAVTHYREAIRLAGNRSPAAFRAELWLNLGTVLQETASGRREPLLEAARAYQEAVRCGLSLDFLPELYAFAQSNLALVYLTLPARDAGDRLRRGIAVQGLREALKVYRSDTHPEMWSSAQLNLANALQYLPSSHPAENLQQSVRLYEELLTVRDRALDPLGYARLLANQANALAHLGIFQPALEKLNEAHKLFHWHGEPEMAASVLDLAAEINRSIEEARS